MNEDFNNKAKSLFVGDVLKLKVLSIGAKGDGICKHNGIVVIVPKVDVGEFYDIEITKILPKCAFGRVRL